MPYVLATGAPFLLALAFPALFFSALDFAGCYGVLTLFGLLPVAMAWSERYEVTGGWSRGLFNYVFIFSKTLIKIIK